MPTRKGGGDADTDGATRAHVRRRAGFSKPRWAPERPRVLGSVSRDIGAVAAAAAGAADGNSRGRCGGLARPDRQRRARRRERLRARPPTEPRASAGRHARHLPRRGVHQRHGVPVRPAHRPSLARLHRRIHTRVRDTAVRSSRRRVHRRRHHHHDPKGLARQGGRGAQRGRRSPRGHPARREVVRVFPRVDPTKCSAVRD